jgi:large subunit ribosomal protein L22
MSKTSAPRLVADNEAIASARGLKGSPQKAQLVLELIRGKTVELALNNLQFCKKRLAVPARKALLSAIANAENNHGLNVDRLVVARAFADKGPVLKRFNPRARGRAAPIFKHRCNITVVVAEQAPKAKSVKPAKAAAPAATPTDANKE